jgi:putative toxin-antitoxin system antitoxin component (TIGR02293 family)
MCIVIAKRLNPMSNVSSKAGSATKSARQVKAPRGRALRLRRSGATPPRSGAKQSHRAAAGERNAIVYQSRTGIDTYVQQVCDATPMQIVEIERKGVPGFFIKDLSKRMELPSSRIFRILGLAKATAEKKAAAGEMIAGRGGQAAIGMVKLLGIAQRIVSDSTADAAQEFDAARWLGRWIERPQPALGGRKPADLLDTPTGIQVVARLLGSIESGAYQ